jgi:kynureninase
MAELPNEFGLGCSMDELLKWRREFPILEKTTYMISHSLGAMPARVYDRMLEFADMWATRGVRAWAEGWWEMPVTVGDLVGRIIGAGPGETVMHQNVSICQSLVCSCFDFVPPRNKIVYQSLDFPSVIYVYEAQKRRGARPLVVESDDGMTVPLERLLAAIDEETLLVPVSHVLFKSASVQDAKAIIDRAHAVGAMVVLDVYQSAGTVPIDVKALDADFVVGGSVKWLCGGPGAGYLYVRPDLRTKLRPTLTGWMAHRAPFAFQTGEIDYADNAFRMLHGTPHVPALYSARSGYEIVLEVGVGRIRAKSQRQTQHLIALAEERGLRVTSPRDPAARGGTVTIDAPHGAAVAKELVRREILVDYRPGAGIRVSPHFYTTDEEVDRTIAEIHAIIHSQAYAAHLDQRGADF